MNIFWGNLLGPPSSCYWKFIWLCNLTLMLKSLAQHNSDLMTASDQLFTNYGELHVSVEVCAAAGRTQMQTEWLTKGGSFITGENFLWEINSENRNLEFYFSVPRKTNQEVITRNWELELSQEHGVRNTARCGYDTTADRGKHRP